MLSDSKNISVGYVGAPALEVLDVILKVAGLFFSVTGVFPCRESKVC